MKLAQLFKLFDAARLACQHSEYVVIGSNSVLGLEPDASLPDDMTMSIDVDAYTRADPGRIFELKDALGEESPFRRAEGYYLDPVSPAVATLPQGWEARLIRHEHDGLRIFFLDPNDAAISKYARGEPRDLRWIDAGIKAGLISPPILRQRARHTVFESEAEQARVRGCLI